jgi:TolB-like protein/DNA-binding winged helix-turn-helix (wHTH) protein/Tfp pilus assembly protein PilF
MDQFRWIYRVDGIDVDPYSHRVLRQGQTLALEPKAFAVLLMLLDHPGEMLDRDRLLDAVWKHRHIAPTTLSRIIAVLRRALGDDADAPRYIETVHGLGYRFIGAVRRDPVAQAADGSDVRGSARAVGANQGASCDSAPAAGTAERSSRRLIRFAAALLVVILAAAVALVMNRVGPAPVPGKSVAVLPFVNMSADEANAYFVDGLRDEILTRLASIGDMKVISRSSADLYASQPANLRSIAGELGVATVLEGSVQRQGDGVHITLQLIDATTDAHLWAESYDRNVADVFAIEREVAEQVAAALKARLLPDESARLAAEPTHSPAAYDHYLQALAQFNPDDPLRTMDLPAEQGRRRVRAAIAELDMALARDPDFALARALMAQSRMVLYWNFEQRSDELLAAAKNLAEEALAQQATLGEARLALALYHFYGFHNYTLALREIELARRSMPNSAKLENFAGLIYRRQGLWEKAIASFEKAAALDPRRAAVHKELATTYWWVKRYAEATLELDVARELAGETAPSLMNGIFRMDLDGDMSQWRPVLDAIAPGSDDFRENLQTFYAYAWLTRDFDGAIRYAGVADDDSWPFGNAAHVPREIWLAWVYTQLNQDEQARPLYAKAHRDALKAIEGNPQRADSHLVLGFAAAGLGLKDEAIREGMAATELTPVSRDAIDGPDYVAGLSLIYLYAGEHDKALDLLQTMVAMPAMHMATPGFLKLNAQWDKVREDPKFKRALAGGEAAIRSRPPRG